MRKSKRESKTMLLKYLALSSSSINNFAPTNIQIFYENIFIMLSQGLWNADNR